MQSFFHGNQLTAIRKIRTFSCLWTGSGSAERRQVAIGDPTINKPLKLKLRCSGSLLRLKTDYLLLPPTKFLTLRNCRPLTTYNNNMASNDTYHEMLKPMSWLFGKWVSNQGKGKYPTVSDFQYAEEAEFYPIGMKPIIQFNFNSWHPVNKTPMHRETGFIRLQPGSNKIAFVVSHNVGVVEIQEGEVKDQTLTVETTEIGRASFNKSPAVKKLIRTLTRNGDQLEQVVDMETDKTGMTEHLRATFDKAAQ